MEALIPVAYKEGAGGLESVFFGYPDSYACVTIYRLVTRTSTLLEKSSDGSAGTLGCDQDNVDVLGGDDTGEVLVLRGREKEKRKKCIKRQDYQFSKRGLC